MLKIVYQCLGFSEVLLLIYFNRKWAPHIIRYTHIITYLRNVHIIIKHLHENTINITYTIKWLMLCIIYMI